MTNAERIDLVARWEAEYRALGNLAKGSIDRASAALDLVSMALDLQAAYAAMGDRYRTAMWERRAWLIQHGQGGLYDGTDAVQWKRRHDSGDTGPALASRFLRRSTVASVVDRDLSTQGPHEGQTTMLTAVKAGVHRAP